MTAFPTAEGFGANAVGGRGGRVIEVTSLDDSGPGSLRSCLEASGPRICVFRVSGTITLKSAIQVRTPYLTVAGQTAPGGVQIKGTGQPDGDWGVWFVNTWDYYELNHDGSTHLVNQAQYAAAEPFSVPPVTLDAVSNLLDKVLAGVGAYEPSRDAIDVRIVNSVRDKTGTSRVLCNPFRVDGKTFRHDPG